MLINQSYLTFLQVADSGSFSKAAKLLFISPVSVMKQINGLEDQLSVQLLHRNTRGVNLTQAGKRLYHGVIELVQASDDITEQVKQIGGTEKLEIRVGASIMRPGTPLINVWQKYASNLRGYKFKLVPVNDDDVTLESPSDKIGTTIDCVVGPCDSQEWYDHYNVLQLGMDQFRLAIPQTHRLANHDQLTFADLQGQTLVLPPENASPILDKMAVDLTKNHPDINVIHTFNFYNTEVFNRYASSNDLLLTRDSWSSLHPSMKTVKVNWTYESPYGIIYAKSPSQKMQKFISIIQKF
ncbi:LysR family transcriptional regulator [Lactiplantibacillus paraplantarum]|uniref:LysR family transcriptional regulator n=1 Tax=Lactiplantibacillus paraplantarum TaxID=60520 RepID=A0A4Q9Y0V2_9LACO|nr:LysR family transcriptional regulator [Lactiplantibacillus paraplantarum]